MSLLAVRDLHVRVGDSQTALTAVDGVDLDVPAGGVVGLVGESGSGKSTLARAMVGLVPAIRGQILLEGRDYRGASRRRLRELRRRVQLVFQDPHASLNPRMTVGEMLGETLSVGRRMRRDARRAEVERLLALVALEPAYARARPGAMSGGERQRVALARALAVRPDVIIADEVTSALDVSIQASMLNLLRDVREQTGLSMLFISHNLTVVRYMSDDVAVMHLGRIVEHGPTERLLATPMHPYTRMLLESASLERLDDGANPVGEAPDPLHLPSGCRFRTACPVGPAVDPTRDVCVAEDPGPTAHRRAHHAACHFAPQTLAPPVEDLTPR